MTETQATEKNISFKYYQVRGETQDLGKAYEKETLALLILRCLGQNATDFRCASNIADVGAFDDNILQLKIGENTNTFMFQMKHKASSKIIPEAKFLTESGGEFALKKYFSDIVKFNMLLNDKTKSKKKSVELLGSSDDIDFIIFTNTGTSRHGFLKEVEPNEYNRISFLNTSKYSNSVYKIELKSFLDAYHNNNKKNINEKDGSGKDSDNVDLTKIDYPVSIYLFVNQIHANNLNSEIENEFRQLSKDYQLSARDIKVVSNKFNKFITKWASGDLGGHYYLEKVHVLSKLAEFFLQKYKFKLDTKKSLTKCDYNMWSQIIKNKTITITDCDETVLVFLESYIASVVEKCHTFDEWGANLSENDKKVFFKNNVGLTKISHTSTGRNENMTPHTIYKYLWLAGKIALLLEIDNQEDYTDVLTILNRFKCSLRFIIVKKREFPLQIDTNTTHFITLRDLSKDEVDVVLDRSVNLQGRSCIKLSDVIDEEIYHHLRCKDVIYIMSHLYNIGPSYQPLKEYYIQRSLTKVLIKSEALEIENQLFIIQNQTKDNSIARLKNVGCKNMKIVNTEHIMTEEELQQFKSSYGAIHWLVFNGNDYFEWKGSHGNSESIKQYRITDKIIPQNINIDIHENINNNLNMVRVIEGISGIGKSTLIDYICGAVPPNFWVLKIILNHHRNHFERLEGDISVSEHLKYFNESMLGKCSNVDLEKAVFERLLNRGKVVILLDGFDEICFSHKREVKDLAKSFHEAKLPIWLTTRPHMKSFLEKEFSTIATTIRPFSLKDQTEFLTKYFSHVVAHSSGEEFIEEFVRELLRAAAINLKDMSHEFSEVPLQIKLLAEVFSADLENSFNKGEITFNDTFNLLYLYEEFTNRKAEILCRKYGHAAKEMRIFTDEHQQLLALKSLFNERDIALLEIDRHLGKYYEKNQNNLDLLQREGLLNVEQNVLVANFVHHTLCEYKAAQWMSENYDSDKGVVRKTVENLLSCRFRNYDADFKFLFKMFDSILSKGFPLHNAIINGQIPEATRLVNIEFPRMSSSIDKGGRSVLHIIALHDRSSSFLSIIEQVSNNINDLILPDSFGYSPLDYAIENWHMSVANVLCEKAENIIINITIEDFEDYFRQCDAHEYKCLFKKLFEYFICSKLLDNDLSDSTDLLDYFSSFNHEIFEKLNLYIREFNIQTASELLEILNIKSPSGSYNNLQFSIIFGTIENINELLATSDINQHHFGYTALHCAIKRNDLEILDLLLSEDNEIDATCHEGNTALHMACAIGNTEMIDRLLLNRANINKYNRHGETPLFSALENKRATAFELLLKRGNPKIDVENIYGHSCLHIAARTGQNDVIPKLISKGLVVNKRNRNGETPLFLALQNNHNSTAKLLLSHGANVDSIDQHGNISLHLAVQTGDESVVLELINKGFSTSKQNKIGETPLLVAVKNKSTSIAKLLISDDACTTVDRQGNSCLHHAVKTNQEDLVKELILRGCSVNLFNKIGETPLLIALENNHGNIINFLISREFALDNIHGSLSGGDVQNLASSYTEPQSPQPCNVSKCLYLHAAAKIGHKDIVFKLIEKGCDVNEKNEKGESPLCVALKHGHAESAEILLEGLNVDCDNQHDCYCLYRAVELGRDNIVLTLLHKGLDVNKLHCNKTLLAVALENRHTNTANLLISEGVKVKRDSNFFYLLTAAATGQKDVIPELIKKGASINEPNRDGKTPLFLALENKRTATAQLLLCNNDLDINFENEYSNSYLHAAAETDENEILVHLMQKGADVNKTNKKGESPILLALKNKNLESAKLLSKASDINLKTNNGSCHLHYAAEGGCLEAWLDTIASIDDSYSSIDVNLMNNRKQTLLHFAVFKNYFNRDMDVEDQLATVNFLLHNAADANLQDKYGYTPLHYISKYKYAEGAYDKQLTDMFYEKAAKLFLQNNVDVRLRNRKGKTALNLAQISKRNNISSILRQY